MNVVHRMARRAVALSVLLAVPFALVVATGATAQQAALAQDADQPPADPAAGDRDARVAQGEQAAEAALASGEEKAAENQTEQIDPAKQAGTPEVAKKINLLSLLVAGGHLMWPIVIMSLLVVTFGVERMLGLRRHKVLPPELVGGLGELAGQKGGLDPRKAYKLCQQYPSAAANVIRTMLLKVGRPHAEVEHAVTEANDREAARLYSNVRWLSLAAGVSPLLGLLGTVWGMIQAFFATANLPVGANKAEHLANGIYVALVTTFAGLAVAIPAAVLAHMFEGRIQSLFRELDETLLGMMPQLERFEGRLRVTKDQLDGAVASTARTRPEATAAKPEKQPTAAKPEKQPTSPAPK